MFLKVLLPRAGNDSSSEARVSQACRLPRCWAGSREGRRLDHRGPSAGRSDLGAHLCREPFEVRIGGTTADCVDRRLPHLPPVDQALAEQCSD